MFSFQYPDPTRNYPYYHCDDPEEFLNRSANDYDYNYDDSYQVQVDEGETDDAEVLNAHEIESIADTTIRSRTVDVDRKYISANLTPSTVKHFYNQMKHDMTSDTSCSSSSSVDIDLSVTNPWHVVNASKTGTGNDQPSINLSEIIEEQIHEEKQSNLNKDLSKRDHDSFSEHSASTTTHNSEKTRLCIYGKHCKTNGQCTRAHTLDEWEPNICRFNKRCKNNKCLYYHEGDDKKSYLSNIIESKKDKMAFYSKSKNKAMYIKNYQLAS